MSGQVGLKMVIVVRRDLNMTRGKECAQVAHAALMSILPRQKDTSVGLWLDGGQAKIVLSAENSENLCAIASEAIESNIHVQEVIDAGRTMFGGTNTLTCIAPGPDDSDRLDSITGNLRLI